MAFTLSFSPTGAEDFVGTTGASFTLDITGAAGSGLIIIAMSYGTNTIMAAPFTFKVLAGVDNFLFIHFEALVPGAELLVQEVAGGARQTLETIEFDPGNPGTGYNITGQ